ncbi:MAG: hypothetical protein JWQ94_4276 [Tardiphaga sp.]|nr:hypothetical protein [Tardiphaga sp.]
MQHVREAIMRQAIANSNDASTAARAERLLDCIKCETRWLLISAPLRGFEINEEGHHDERAALVKTWPDIRHRRLPPAFLVSFYDLAADQASRFALLIEIRRQREAKRRAVQ